MVCRRRPPGDQTAIGEKGVNLSGGQKARIQLARAVYSDRDIVVLDDPLSAVDAHVGRFLMDKCILGRLKGKTVVLMTNQIQFLDRADKVVVLKDGKIVGQGRFEELREQGINFDEFIIQNEKKEKKEKKTDLHTETVKPDSTCDDAQEANQIKKLEPTCAKQENSENTSASDVIVANANENDSDSTNQSTSTPSPTLSNTATPFDDKEKAEKVARQMMTEEEQSTGSISFKTYFRFLTAMMPVWLIPFAMLFGVIVESISIFQSYWLGIVPEPTLFAPLTFTWKLVVYGLLTVLSVLFLLLYACVVSCSTRRSNRIIHQRLLRHVMHCPVSFFDTTPLGRVINRFGGDIAQTDMNLIIQLYDVYLIAISFVGQIVIIAISTPSFLFHKPKLPLR
ncbi:Multidrug resistance-associated protein [Blattamonas nauphoetae]|uniref:Multidrug resistance-associated protein n=1 Tax=Blattamonas nauphoetae TaxID=2049346 RepID=A0ABQ9Y9B8_9EUKA|nr:Multidrug resistance-associated protein [Blattamonas nauphoetae]